MTEVNGEFERKFKEGIDHEAMAAGYMQMVEINLEEANVSLNQWNEGMELYGDLNEIV